MLVTVLCPCVALSFKKVNKGVRIFAWSCHASPRPRRSKAPAPFSLPRPALPPSTEPCFEPELVHPKSVHRQVKADGSIKKREITDFGAERERVHPNAGENSFILIKEDTISYRCNC